MAALPSIPELSSLPSPPLSSRRACESFSRFTLPFSRFSVTSTSPSHSRAVNSALRCCCGLGKPDRPSACTEGVVRGKRYRAINAAYGGGKLWMKSWSQGERMGGAVRRMMPKRISEKWPARYELHHLCSKGWRCRCPALQRRDHPAEPVLPACLTRCPIRRVHSTWMSPL